MSQVTLTALSLGESVAVTQFETVFDDTVKTSDQTALVNTNGATNIVVMQTATNVPSGARTITSSSGWTDPPVVINDNLNDSTAATTNGGTIVVDFGSIATRNISSKARAVTIGNSGAVTGAVSSVSVEYSEDDSAYSGGGSIVSSPGQQSQTVDNTATRTDNDVSMRYARISTVLNPGANSYTVDSYAFEVFDDTGLGISTIQFEILDDASSEWRELIPASVFPTQNSNNGSFSVTQVGHDMEERYALPYTTTNFRIKMNVTDGVNTSVTVAKIIS